MRRFILASFFVVTAASAAPKARVAQPTHATHASREHYPAVALFGAHVNEALAYRPRDERGRMRHDSSTRLERLLRCRQTGQQHHVDVRLADALYQVGLHFAGHRIEIFSGYRPRAFCERAHSRHMNGSAVDFIVDGIDNAALVAYLRHTFHPAGVGFYPHGVHVHLDFDRVIDTYWVDAAPPAGDPAVDPIAGPLPAPPPPDTTIDLADDVPPRDSAPVGAAEPADGDPLLDAPNVSNQEDLDSQ